MRCSPSIRGTNRAAIELKMKERALAVPRKLPPPFARRSEALEEGLERDEVETSKETGSSDEGGQCLKDKTNYRIVKRNLGKWFGLAFRDPL